MDRSVLYFTIRNVNHSCCTRNSFFFPLVYTWMKEWLRKIGEGPIFSPHWEIGLSCCVTLLLLSASVRCISPILPEINRWSTYFLPPLPMNMESSPKLQKEGARDRGSRARVRRAPMVRVNKMKKFIRLLSLNSSTSSEGWNSIRSTIDISTVENNDDGKIEKNDRKRNKSLKLFGEMRHNMKIAIFPSPLQY